jgi:hypothetical protein
MLVGLHADWLPLSMVLSLVVCWNFKPRTRRFLRVGVPITQVVEARSSANICQPSPKRAQSCFDCLTVGSRRVPT